MSRSSKVRRNPSLLLRHQMPAGEFKAKCLEVMDTVSRERTSVVITKHGRPVARLVPAGAEVLSPIGALAGSVVRGDVVAPDREAWRSWPDPLDQRLPRG
jgi:prevent-host-death family protein